MFIGYKETQEAENYLNMVLDNAQAVHEAVDRETSNTILAAAYEVRSDMKMATEQLVGQARSIAERMTELADRVEVNGMAASVNSIGELQGRGAELDTLCKQFAMVRQEMVLFHKMASAMLPEVPTTEG